MNRQPLGSRTLLPTALVALAAAGCRGGPMDGADVLLYRGGDAIGAGQSVVVPDSVAGDAMVAGRLVRLDGPVGGDVLAAGEEVRVNAPVGGSVRAAGRSVAIGSTVGRRVTATGAEVRLEPDATVEGNLYAGGARVVLDGAVRGLVHASGERVELNGPVGGDVYYEGAGLRVGPGARIAGALTYRSAEGPATVSPEAVIEGGISRLPARPDAGFPGPPPIPRVYFILAFLVAGGVLVALAPRAMTAAARTVRARLGPSAGWGALILFLSPPAIMVVAATVLGLPLALMAAALYLACLYLAPVPVAAWLGGRLLEGRLGRSRVDTLIAFLAGGAVLAVLWSLPVLGFLVRIGAGLVGLGAVAVSLREGGDAAGAA